MFPTNFPKCLNCFRKLYSCRVVFVRSFSQNFSLGAPGFILPVLFKCLYELLLYMLSAIHLNLCFYYNKKSLLFILNFVLNGINFMERTNKVKFS